MYIALWVSVASVALVYTTIQVLLVVLRNYKAFKFFKTKVPELPVVPDKANIFFGHLFGVIIRDDNVQKIAELHKQLGPTFGYYFCDQPWVTTKDLDLIKLIEQDESHKHINRALIPLPFKEYNHGIFQANDDAWRRQRSAIAPALTNRKVRSEETTGDIESVIEQLAAVLKSRLVESSMILDAGDMFQRYTLAVIFLVLYQRERVVDFIGPEEKWVTSIDEGARLFVNPFAMASVALPFTQPVVEFFAKWHKVGRIHAEIISYSKTTIDLNQAACERLQRNKSGGGGREVVTPRDGAKFKRRLVDTIIDALFEKRIQYDEFLGNIEFLLLAAIRTTADTITCLVWQLAKHPEIQEQLRACIRNDGLDSEYLEWCIKETIRFHPAVPLGVGRVLGEDVQVNGVRLPKGTYVMPSTYAIHHDSKIWPEPEKFKPERWMRTEEHHPAAFMGFGLGPRNCVGGKLAMHEIKLVMRMLLESYRIETCAETPNEFAFSSAPMIFTVLKAPIRVRLVELNNNVS